jgi:uncharacterized protein (DUF58 family)
MSAETVALQPVFDPANPGASLDRIHAELPQFDGKMLGLISGETVSPKRGTGADRDGVRPFEEGDDVRNIDWNVTARQPDRWPQVRLHMKDITPSMYIVTDMLQSRHEAAEPGYYTEQELALSATAAFLRIARGKEMPATVIASSDNGIRTPKPEPQQGRKPMLNTMQRLSSVALEEKPKQEASHHLSDLLGYAARHCTQSLVVVISDFRDKAPDAPNHAWGKPLDRLSRQGNQLIAVETTNPNDFKLPELVSRFEANGEKLWADEEDQRAQYEQDAKAQQKAIDGALAAAGVHHIKLDTTEPRWMDAFLTGLRRS